jgi:hypothetical protein
MVQRRAARYVTNSHNNRSSVNQMLEHLEWKSLEHEALNASTDGVVTIPGGRAYQTLIVREKNEYFL